MSCDVTGCKVHDGARWRTCIGACRLNGRPGGPTVKRICIALQACLAGPQLSRCGLEEVVVASALSPQSTTPESSFHIKPHDHDSPTTYRLN